MVALHWMLLLVHGRLKLYLLTLKVFFLGSELKLWIPKTLLKVGVVLTTFK